MKQSVKFAVAAFFGLGALTVSATSASAAIACNAEGQCWHVRHPYAYPPAYGVVIHPNGWRWGPSEHYVWREHAGRGYWRGGVWIRFLARHPTKRGHPLDKNARLSSRRQDGGAAGSRLLRL